MLLIVISGIALIIGLGKLYVKLTTGWCRSQVCLKGKTVIVTGANTGIGYETAIDFAKRGARVILACRNEDRARQACEKIIKETHNEDVVYKLVDFESLKSVRKFADCILKQEKRLDILVNNAALADLKDKISEDGLLLLMQVNYFGPVLLTELLLDFLKKFGGRIVNVSSMAGNSANIVDVKKLNEYVGWRQYNVTKLCNILYTIQLAERLKATQATTYSLHPGIVYTEFLRILPIYVKGLAEWLVRTFFKSATEGAQTSIYCSVANDLEQFSGQHFADCHVIKRYQTAADPLLPRQVWEETKKVLKLE